MSSQDNTILKNLALKLDTVSATTYIGDAQPGALSADPVWRIKRVVETGSDAEIKWADGNSDFDNIWTNRLALSYI